MKIFKYTKIFCLLALVGVMHKSCKKQDNITSPDAVLFLSTDTLRFDTVFTQTGSFTQFVKIFNANAQGLNLSSVQLMGGDNSPFKLNVDGVSGSTFTNVNILKSDSVYMFATVSINPTAANLPFLIKDSIKITYNGNVKWLQLTAYGQNANYIRKGTVTKDSSFTNEKPVVIIDELLVNENKTLTIPKGCKIYCETNAAIVVKGSLKALGEKYDSTKIVFQGNRLDAPYKYFPGMWQGIFFTPTAKSNFLQHCVIQNAQQGVVIAGNNTTNKLQMNSCIIHNIYDIGLQAVASNFTANNCQISNCGRNVLLTGGGTYTFNHCSIIGINGGYFNRKYPAFTVADTNSLGYAILPTNLKANNCIIYADGGLVDDEVIATRVRSNISFNALFKNVLYKAKNDIVNISFINCLKNQVPLFDSVNVGQRIFNFKPKALSPVIDAGFDAGFSYDLNQNPRVGLPDLGCYEKQ